MMKVVLCLVFFLGFSLSVNGQVRVLKGSPFSQERENAEADRVGLPRIYDDIELERHKEDGTLVPLRETVGLFIDSRLDPKFRFVLPWTRDFLERLGEKFHHEFKRSIQINSAVRTLLHQAELIKSNKNAAPTTGDRQSTHPTGATIDIAKLNLNPNQIKWLRIELLQVKLRNEGEVTEEWHQAVFHVMVFKPEPKNLPKPLHTEVVPAIWLVPEEE